MNVQAVWVLAKFEARQILGQKKFWLLCLFLALPVGLTLLIRTEGGMYQDPIVAAVHIYLLYPQSFCILVAALYGTSIVQNEISGKTITYLLIRPVPRPLLLLGKYLGTWLTLSTLSTLSCWAALLIAHPEGCSRFMAVFAAAIFLAVGVYTALFCFFGLLTRTALVIAIAYGLVIEGIVSFMPAVIKKLCCSYYIRSLLWEGLDLKLPPDFRQLQDLLGGPGILEATGILLVVTVVALGVSMTLLARREYHITEHV